ncbi:hypothetical protein NM688_g3447 [Phlebia brevispora]|uniref:Uncharacterized protein n=1 Tax=Phlebia brevispora TaxID=194682 RepID=A0ACC1T5H3_9APHY|nr:hypothetical protein NM688_g3447 [Phlebia brevispora]
MVAYNGVWYDSSHEDPEWFDYTNGTFHATQEEGATAYLTFNGSAVYVVGARRTNHGEYSATLDEATTVQNGEAPVDQFNCTLYSHTGLDEGQHEVILQNEWPPDTPNTWFDIDYMVITSGDGNPATQSTDTTLDDSGTPNITYTYGWDTSPNGLQQYYYMSTMHRTNLEGASAYIIFHGNAITLYGSTSYNHGLFSIALDGVPLPYTLNGSAPVNQTRWQNMLYYSGGLSSSLHNMTVTHADPNDTMWFDLDKVVVSNWPVQMVDLNPSSSSSTQLAAPTVSSASSGSGDGGPPHSVNKRLIAGVVTAIVAVVLFSAVLLIVCRRRQTSHTDGEGVAPMNRACGFRSANTRWQIEPFPTEERTNEQGQHVRKFREDLPSEQPVPVSFPTTGTDLRRMLSSQAHAQSSHSPGLAPPAYDEAINAQISRPLREAALYKACR